VWDFLRFIFLLHVKYVRSPTWVHALKGVDWLGNAIFFPSMISIFLGLITGGVENPWRSWRTILPIVLGVLGWIAFHLFQASPECKEPSTPPRLFRHRTTTVIFAIIFLGSIIMQAIAYFLPIYFQAVRSKSPLTSGVYFLPFALAIIPFGGLTRALMSKYGHYIPLHFLGFALCALGAGLLSLLNETSSTGAWVGYQIIVSGGVGIIFTATIPSTLAPVPQCDIAVATGTYSFIRSFGLVWGVTIASIVFNNQFEDRLSRDIPASIIHQFRNGAAYSPASSGFVKSLDITTSASVVRTYVHALQVVWLVIAAVGCLGFVIVFAEQHVEFRTDINTEFSLVEKHKGDNIEIVPPEERKV
jgi:hypothetical protein